MSYISNLTKKPDTVVFLDGDYSDFPEQMIDLVAQINEGYDLVIGSRALGDLERGAMQPQQIFGNWLATSLIKLIYKYEFTDLGPFRAIKYDKLVEIDMQDVSFWYN